MNIENGTKWAQALRSGEFKQTRRMLRSMDGGYCCLGVACELYRRETGKGEWVQRYTGSDWTFKEGNHALSGTLPPDVRAWLGVDGGDPMIAPALRAIDMNDDLHYTFEQIADVIEQELEQSK